MSHRTKMFVLVGVDMLIVWISIYSSYLFRFNGSIPPPYLRQCLIYSIVSARSEERRGG